MSNANDSLIALDDAHELLAAFGIGPDNREYQRWERDDGFRLDDLEDVLNKSSYVLSVDWRECLQDALETIQTQLASLGISVTLDLDEEGNHGYIEVNGTRAAVKYVPNDDDDFDNVIKSIDGLIADKAQYRIFRSCEGTDGWTYGVLSSDDWGSLEKKIPHLLRLLFATKANVTVVEGDLLDQDVDVIVNAWNRNIIPWWLLLPQGVSGAIKKRGGTGPFKDLAKHGPIPLGAAVLTSAGNLPFKAIIHVAGINMLWRASEQSIRDSVRNAIKIVEENGFHSIAFPLIGAGSGGFNQDRSKEIMLDELQKLESSLQVTVVEFRKP